MPIDVRGDPPLPKPTGPFGSTGPIDGVLACLSGLLPPCRYDSVRPSMAVAVTNRSAPGHRHDLDLVAGLKHVATITIADIKQSALANGNVKLVPQLPSGPSQYERLAISVAAIGN